MSSPSSNHRDQWSYLPGGRVPEGGEQHDVALVEALADLLGLDLAHLSRVPEVDALDHAQRLGRVEEVPAHHVDAHQAGTACARSGAQTGAHSQT